MQDPNITPVQSIVNFKLKVSVWRGNYKIIHVITSIILLKSAKMLFFLDTLSINGNYMIILLTILLCFK